jgi:hypothetical protein
MLVRRCTVHKYRKLLAHAPSQLHDEISDDYNDMIFATTKQEIEAKRKSFIRKWRLKCLAVADTLEEAGDARLSLIKPALLHHTPVSRLNACGVAPTTSCPTHPTAVGERQAYRSPAPSPFYLFKLHNPLAKRCNNSSSIGSEYPRRPLHAPRPGNRLMRFPCGVPYNKATVRSGCGVAIISCALRSR